MMDGIGWDRELKAYSAEGLVWLSAVVWGLVFSEALGLQRLLAEN